MNVSLSADRVLESLEQKGEGNNSMSSGEESLNVRIKARGYSIQGRSQYEANRGTCLSHCFFFFFGESKIFFKGERKALAANKLTNS